MTTKHATDESVHDTISSAVAPTSGDTQQAEDASRELLAKARYDAFRLMTEARDEAETILDGASAEAAGIRKAADLEAESTADKANAQAAEIIEAAYEEAAEIVAKGHRTAGEGESADSTAELEEEHRELSERVSTLRVLADQLENRFAALAETAKAEPVLPKEPVTDSPAADAAPDADTSQAAAESASDGDAATAQSAAPILDYSPSVAPPVKSEEETEPKEEERESFYNRRSAKLPRIGVDGGRDAFDMTRTIRAALDSD